MAMRIQNQFSLEQELYLKSDPEQHKYICTAIMITPIGLMYELTCGNESAYHYDMEISDR